MLSLLCFREHLTISIIFTAQASRQLSHQESGEKSEATQTTDMCDGTILKRCTPAQLIGVDNVRIEDSGDYAGQAYNDEYIVIRSPTRLPTGESDHLWFEFPPILIRESDSAWQSFGLRALLDTDCNDACNEISFSILCDARGVERDGRNTDQSQTRCRRTENRRARNRNVRPRSHRLHDHHRLRR